MSKERKLVGYNNFVRTNPCTDKFDMIKFHSLEFYCSDAVNFSSRFAFGIHFIIYRLLLLISIPILTLTLIFI